MKKSLLLGAMLCATISQHALAADGEFADNRGDRIEQRLDNRGDRIEERMDNRGDRI